MTDYLKCHDCQHYSKGRAICRECNYRKDKPYFKPLRI